MMGDERVDSDAVPYWFARFKLEQILKKERAMISIGFQTEGAAFEADGLGPSHESARILREIAKALEDHQVAGVIRDVNGNSIGSWTLRR